MHNMCLNMFVVTAILPGYQGEKKGGGGGEGKGRIVFPYLFINTLMRSSRNIQ